MDYSKAAFEDTQTTKGCEPAGGPKLLDVKAKKEKPSSTMFKSAVKAAGLEIDGANIEFLPIWRGSAERYEDHQQLTKYQKETHQFIDCTHFCTHGNVNRFWNSALVATMSSMQEK